MRPLKLIVRPLFMPSRHLLLASVLAVALVVFCYFLVAELHAGSIGMVLFGGSFFAAAVLLLRRRGEQAVHGVGGMSRGLWIWLASYAVAGASLLVLALLLMPVLGFKAFELMGTLWFPALLPLATLCAYPLVARRLR